MIEGAGATGLFLSGQSLNVQRREALNDGGGFWDRVGCILYSQSLIKDENCTKGTAVFDRGGPWVKQDTST